MKTKALISFAVNAKLICVFVFAYTKCWFSYDAAHIFFTLMVISFGVYLASAKRPGFLFIIFKGLGTRMPVGLTLTL